MRGRIGGCVYLGEVAQYDFVTGGVGEGGDQCASADGNAPPTTLKVFEKNPRLFIDSGGVANARREVLATVEREDVVVLVE